MKAYEVITNRTVEKLEQGIVPWHQPWSWEMPKNPISQKQYWGINVFVLGSMGFANPYWLTFSQAKELVGHVRKGAKACPVVFWKWVQKQTGERDEDGQPIVDQYPVLRYYNVFNVEQCDEIPAEKIPPVENAREFHAIEQAEKAIQGMPHCPKIEYRGSQAYYRPFTDTVTMPPAELFQSDEDFYSVLFLELTHSTDHPSRLHRFDNEQLAPFGSRDYSQEELVAETFLCGRCGIVNQTIDNSAAYIQGWLTKLRNDKRMVVFAAAQARKAADFILGRKGGEDD